MHGAAVTGLLLADVLMIVMGFYLGALITVEPKWLWLTISCGTSVAGCHTIRVLLAQKRRAKSPKVQEAFWAQVAVLFVLSLVYPALIAVAPDQLGLIDEGSRQRGPCRHRRNGQSRLRARVRDRRPAADYG